MSSTMDPVLRQRIIDYNKTILASKETADMVNRAGGIRAEGPAQSDKVGYNWISYYVNDILVYTEYVEQEIPVGTKDNPFIWEAELLLIPNAYYTHEKIRKVWTGPAGITAFWTDERFVEF